MYGLVLSFDLNIPFPPVWQLIKRYYDYFPFCLSIDLDGAWARGDGQLALRCKLQAYLYPYMLQSRPPGMLS